MTFQYRHDSRSFSGEITRVGPAIQVVAFEGEFHAALTIGWMQCGHSSAVVTAWEVDGPVHCTPLSATNADWPRYWRAFLSIMPPGLAEAVQAFEDAFHS